MIEDAQRHSLGQRTGLTHWTDAAGTPIVAPATGYQRPRAEEHLVVHREERTAEADAAGICVVDEDGGRVAGRLGRARARPSILALRPTCIDREPQIVAVAHEQERRNLFHRECQTENPVAA